MNDLCFLLIGAAIGAVAGIIGAEIAAAIRGNVIYRREKRAMKRLGMGTPRFCKTQWPEGRGE